MEATPTELQKHVIRINAVLQETCEASDPAPLIRLTGGTIALTPSSPALHREVVSDLGYREIALRFPIPDSRQPRFWIAMQEQWEWKGRHRLSFRECGLRLYMGDRNEEAVQFLRLEWVAPTAGLDGEQSYPGKHAGHPHWHVDRSALLGQEDYYRSLEMLTAPSAPQVETEDFGGTAARIGAPAQPLLDFSWLQNMHLPARAKWMESEWDGRHVPGPHQCEPRSVDELAHWWAGALRYISAELPR
jgi:hypothetical protein